MGSKPPPSSSQSLVDLRVKKAICNINRLGDVGQTELLLLDRILPHCTVEGLRHVEDSTKELKDLSPVTDKVWENFYIREFGSYSHRNEVERMNSETNKKTCLWRKLYQEKEKCMERSFKRFEQLAHEEQERKQIQAIQMCYSKVPSASNCVMRRFRPTTSDHGKGKIMNKAMKEYQNCFEVKNLAFTRNKTIQKNHSVSSRRLASSSASDRTKSISR